MRSVNKVILLGNVGNNPEDFVFDSGDSVCSFSLATSNKWATSDGEIKEQTTWHKIIVKRQALVDVVMEYVNKGDLLYIEGMITNRSYEDDDEITHYITEILMFQLVMLGGGNDSKKDTKKSGKKASNKRSK